MKTDKNVVIIDKILQYCGQVSQTVERFGKNEELFKDDFVYHNACNMCILQIGELVGKLDEEFKREYPGIPWNQVKAMRNIFAHNYSNVDFEQVWPAIVVDLPILEEYCRYILEKERNKGIEEKREI